MNFSIRSGPTPGDYPQVADLLTASDPQWPVTPEFLALEEAQRDPQLFFAKFVVERGERLIAVGVVGEDGFAKEPGKYWMSLHVHPQFRRLGVGSALYAHLMGVLHEQGARKVVAMTGEDRPDVLSFLHAREFREVWRRYESRLDTRELDSSRFEQQERELRERGVQLASIADLAGDERRDERLYELDWLLMQDVPMGETLTKRSFEQWRREELLDPHFEHAASFVAVDPARTDDLTGPYVGYSSLMNNPAGFWVIGMTGVLREYRGMGLARALKLRGARYVQAHGAGEIRTFNDPPNVAMLRVNEQLGFIRQPPRLRYLLEV